MKILKPIALLLISSVYAADLPIIDAPTARDKAIADSLAPLYQQFPDDSRVVSTCDKFTNKASGKITASDLAKCLYMGASFAYGSGELTLAQSESIYKQVSDAVKNAN